MSNEIDGEQQGRDVQKPVCHSDLPEKLCNQFKHLFDRIYDLFNVHDEREEIQRAGQQISDLIIQEVTKEPILARAAHKEVLGWSLLGVVCEKTHANPILHAAIKFLINVNPHALLWKWSNEFTSSGSPLQCIASEHCALLPWIARNHIWIFEHPTVRNNGDILHGGFLRSYTYGDCEASIVREFFELYPRALETEDKYGRWSIPLHVVLSGWSGWEECDFGLVKWMVKEYPESLKRRNGKGMTALFKACEFISSVDHEMDVDSCSENMASICRFFMQEYSEAVRIKARRGRGLPLHYLARRCNKRLIQELVIDMLKVYPEAVHVKARNFLPKLSTVPFIRAIGPLLQRQAELKQEEESLEESRRLFQGFSESDAGAGVVPEKISEVFSMWVATRVVTFRDQHAALEMEIAGIKEAFEGDDEVSDTDEESGMEGDCDWSQYDGDSYVDPYECPF